MYLPDSVVESRALSWALDLTKKIKIECQREVAASPCGQHPYLIKEVKNMATLKAEGDILELIAPELVALRKAVGAVIDVCGPHEGGCSVFVSENGYMTLRVSVAGCRLSMICTDEGSVHFCEGWPLTPALERGEIAAAVAAAIVAFIDKRNDPEKAVAVAVENRRNWRKLLPGLSNLPQPE